MSKVKFIDLFAGLGGIRLGFENAFNDLGIETECVLTSEIKPYAIKTLEHNFGNSHQIKDIYDINYETMPDFDFLLGGFPCQPFSSGGKRQGFLDTRGTLFFEIEKILKEKAPSGFILENVDGLVKHDLEKKNDKIGRTLKTILYKLEKELKYKVTWKVMDSINFGLPQSRKRIFIVGSKDKTPVFDKGTNEVVPLNNILETGLETLRTEFTDSLFKYFTIEDLYGKSIKDKRGGDNNIHSWDIGIKGEVSDEQILLLNKLFKERRRKHWAKEIGIDWMDGMPLTKSQIATFFPSRKLKSLLNDLVKKRYLRFEHPKKLVVEKLDEGERKYREYDTEKPKGYNIVTGKLSFEINKILDPNDIAPTLVATDVSRLVVPDGNGLRRLTIREGLRLFGYPPTYEIPASEDDAFDLLGNTVAVPVVQHVADSLAEIYQGSKSSYSKTLPVEAV